MSVEMSIETRPHQLFIPTAEITLPKIPVEAVAIVMVIAQKPSLMVARLRNSLPEVVAEEMPARLRGENPLGIHANIPYGGERKVWKTRGGSGRSRERCTRCRQKHSAGSNFLSGCQANGISKSKSYT